MNKPPITVIILTKNEEVNLPQCLAHLAGWADEVVVLDSGSTDRTEAIAREAGATVATHPFAGYVEQRNWALRELPVRNEWILFVDADEYPTEELKKEISEVLNLESQVSSYNGFYIARRFIWEGKWIQYGGYYPVWILRLMRRKFARCEGMLMDEHFTVEGAVGRLAHDLVHDDRRGLADWKEKHRRYAEYKAREYLAGRSNEGPTGDDVVARARAAKRGWYDRLPLFLRAVLYFKYVFFLRGGFLDGPTGWRYHLLHALWYPWNIDREIVKLRNKK